MRRVVFLCWKQDSSLEVSRHLIASRLNAHSQTDWAIEDQAKNLNSTARPYYQQAFNPLDPTAVWHSHLALAIYMFVVVDFDALAQASDIRIERRQVVFLCWEQDSNPPGSQTPNRQQTECSPFSRRRFQLHFHEWNYMNVDLNFTEVGSEGSNHPLVHILAWCWPGDKSLSEPMMFILLTHTCVTRPRLVDHH